jgi:hypothetical protein
MLNAFHIDWTKPFFCGSPNCSYYKEDYELLTTILSALSWRKHNGSIKMVSDAVGTEYYRNLGLAHIWDSGIDPILDILIDDSINPLSFWAAGKIFALKEQNTPCVMIDTDFIVWKPLATAIKNETLVVAHCEDINAEIYPDKNFFIMDKNYQFPLEWDWKVLPCNTALMYIADEWFKEYYTSESIRFMQNLMETKDTTAEMVFAEQRLLAMCAAAKGITIKTFLDMNSLDTQASFTHIWGLKNDLQINQEKRREFCLSCVRRIANDFNEEIATLNKIECLKPYVEATL